MKKVKMAFESFASPSEVQAAIREAVKVSSNGKNKVDIIRDADGKVIAVDVNLPHDTAKGNLDNACAKINANSGVAVCLHFPQICEDFDDFVEDQVYTSFSDADMIIRIRPDYGCSVVGSGAAEGKDATACLKIKDTLVQGGNEFFGAQFAFIPTENALASVSAFKTSYDVKCLNDGKHGNIAWSEEIRFSWLNWWTYFVADVNQGSLNWFFQDDMAGTREDTGVSHNDWLSVAIESRADGTNIIQAGNFSKTIEVLSPNLNDIWTHFIHGDNFSEGEEALQNSTLIDNFCFEVVDAILL